MKLSQERQSALLELALSEMRKSYEAYLQQSAEFAARWQEIKERGKRAS